MRTSGGHKDVGAVRLAWRRVRGDRYRYTVLHIAVRNWRVLRLSLQWIDWSLRLDLWVEKVGYSWDWDALALGSEGNPERPSHPESWEGGGYAGP